MNMMIDIAKVADLVGSDKFFWILKAGDKPSPKIDIYCAHLFFYRLLVNQEHRNNGTPEQGTPEQHHSGTRNTGTLKILNLLKIRREKIPGGV
jgi:hypothetical protein